MSSELTAIETMPPPARPPAQIRMPPFPSEYERTTHVVPLNYETPPGPTAAEVTKLKLLSIAARRLCLGAGVGFVTGGIIVMNSPYADEEAICIGLGVGLIVAAIPLPKRWF